MKYTLCEYQREAVYELVSNSEKLMLSSQNNKRDKYRKKISGNNCK